MMQLVKALRQVQPSRLYSLAAAVPTTTTTSPTVAAPAEPDQLYSKLEIELRGVDPAVLKSYTWFATTAAEHLNIELGKCWSPRKAHHERMTLLKSVHIYKKHRVQYEIRTHFRYMNFHKLTGSTLDTFLEYIERNLPEGVALQATKTELQQIPEHLRQPPEQV
ncbi:small ribosomal subunit protein uS10m [Drosophila nasuta]|uniref:Small ribosomal subunit protein uS10m n=1 Tax=Drosophila albomicans TaxID=7291 RepID=A0A6P8ZEL3_DROAB|nr:28S ribosomal protein S10, mitochondrial [Drosophila albomicans]XP_060648926.1 small ribosomal subunit protein uS10m [Drosophila nasuta]